MKRIIKIIFINTYAYFINLWLFLINTFSKNKYIYPEFVSFGDTYMFYLFHYSEIIKDNNKKVILFGRTDGQFIKLIFDKKKYITSPFYLFNFLPDHQIHSTLRKMKNFKPTMSDYTKVRNKDSIKNLININFNKKKIISEDLIEFTNAPYFLLFIKFYNENYNDLKGSNSRQTSDLKKVYSLMEFLLNLDIRILVMGNRFDKSIYKIEKFNFNDKNKDIKFFDKLSKNYSLYDQLHAINNSIGFIGNGCGFTEPVYFQKKKLVIFDYPFDPTRDPRHNLKYKKFLYKKIEIDGKETVLDVPTIEKISINDNYKYKVIDTPLDTIIEEIKKTFLI
jgi:hypothetical protein